MPFLFLSPPLMSLCKCHFGTVFCDSINLVIKALQIRKKKLLIKSSSSCVPSLFSLNNACGTPPKMGRDKKIDGFLAIWRAHHYHRPGLHLHMKITQRTVRLITLPFVLTFFISIISRVWCCIAWVKATQPRHWRIDAWITASLRLFWGYTSFVLSTERKFFVKALWI